MSAPTDAAPIDRELAEHIRAERVRFVFIQSALPILFSPVAASILATALWSLVEHERLIAWTSALLFIAVMRILLIRSYPKGTTTPERVQRWERTFVASIMLVDL